MRQRSLYSIIGDITGQCGGVDQDNRRFINAVFWVLRTGVPWRDLSSDYGKWGTPSEVHPVAEKRDLGKAAGNSDR
ncbi:transposase [Oscillospiraceae bacterium 44-34]